MPLLKHVMTVDCFFRLGIFKLLNLGFAVKKIWKYAITDKKCFESKFPYNSRIIHADIYDSKFTFWVEFDTDTVGNEIRKFAIYDTGEEIPYNYVYITTVVDHGYVYHMYEIISDIS